MNRKRNKNRLSFVFLFASVSITTAQNTFPSTGNAGIGITSPNANLHLYGTTDYVVPGKFGGTINYGKTSCVLLTTTNSGNSNLDGFEIRYSGVNATLINQETNASIGITSGGATLSLQGAYGRIAAGSVSINSANTFGYFNVQSSTDNGIFVRTIASGKFGIRVQVPNTTTNALEVVNASNTAEKNFTVNGAGQVFARKYTTTLSNIPDYVFDDAYELMPLDSLQRYVEINNHLPNIPSAEEYEAEGVDLGEMNRLLLEKVEELTLYVLQLKEEIELLK